MSPLAEGLALIFDMDGVIVDSNPLHRDSWTEFNRRQGLPTTSEMLARMYGRRNDRIVRDFFGDALPEDQVAAYGRDKEKIYREMLGDRIEETLSARFAAVSRALPRRAHGGRHQRRDRRMSTSCWTAPEFGSIFKRWSTGTR